MKALRSDLSVPSPRMGEDEGEGPNPARILCARSKILLRAVRCVIHLGAEQNPESRVALYSDPHLHPLPFWERGKGAGRRAQERLSQLRREGVDPVVAGDEETAVGCQDRDEVTQTRHRIAANEHRLAGIAPETVQAVVAFRPGHPDDRIGAAASSGHDW